jgi:tetratricopeptide (TPR) repeat protein
MNNIVLIIFGLLLSGISFAAPPDSVVPALSPAQKKLFFEQLEKVERAGNPAQADSLFGVIDKYGILTADHLYRWVRIRGVLNRYGGCVDLYLRILEADPRSMNGIYGQWYQLFENAPPDSIGRALAVFERAVFVRRGIDTLGVQLWLSDFYARHGMDSAEVSVLSAVSATVRRLVPQLLDIARERFGRGLFAQAVVPAAIAYDKADNPRMKSVAADLQYLAYQAMYKYDSALVWLERGGISGERRAAAAAALYQYGGKLPAARALIDKLPASLSRDTLEIRQLIFSGDMRKALERAAALGERYPQDAVLWKVRTMLFGGAFEELAALLDTAAVSPSGDNAKKVLDCRYRLQLFRRTPAALAAWSQIESDIFTGKTARAMQRIGEQSVPADLNIALALRIVNECVARGGTDAATAVFLKMGESVDSPEYLYRYAETSFKTGAPARAQELLRRIIRDYPSDVFSEKARVLLARLRR